MRELRLIARVKLITIINRSINLHLLRVPPLLLLFGRVLRHSCHWSPLLCSSLRHDDDDNNNNNLSYATVSMAMTTMRVYAVLVLSCRRRAVTTSRPLRPPAADVLLLSPDTMAARPLARYTSMPAISTRSTNHRRGVTALANRTHHTYTNIITINART